jgi:hypothetical protein
VTRKRLWLVIGAATIIVVGAAAFVAWNVSPRAGQCGHETSPRVIERGVPCNSDEATHQIVEVIRSGAAVCPSGIVTYEGGTGICWQPNPDRPMATLDPPPSP